MKIAVARTLDTVEKKERVYNLIDNNKHENALFMIYGRDG